MIRLTVKEENRAEAIQILRASIRSFSLRGIFKENGGREPIEETEEWDEAPARRLFAFVRID